MLKIENWEISSAVCLATMLTVTSSFVRLWLVLTWSGTDQSYRDASHMHMLWITLIFHLCHLIVIVMYITYLDSNFCTKRWHLTNLPSFAEELCLCLHVQIKIQMKRLFWGGEDYIFAHAKPLLMLLAVSANDGIVMRCPAVPCSFVCMWLYCIKTDEARLNFLENAVHIIIKYVV